MPDPEQTFQSHPAYDEGLHHGHIAGIEYERARIVAWLRETGGYKPGVINTGTRAHVADAIERGEHAG